MDLNDYKTEIEKNKKELLGPTIHIPDEKAYDNIRRHLDLGIDREVQKHLFKRVVGIHKVRDLSLRDAVRFNKALGHITDMEATDFICKAEFRHRDLILKKVVKPTEDFNVIPKKISLIKQAKKNLREQIGKKARKKELEQKILENKNKEIEEVFLLRSRQSQDDSRVFKSPSNFVREMTFEEFQRKRYKVLQSGNASFCQNKELIRESRSINERESSPNKSCEESNSQLPDAWFTMKDEGFKGPNIVQLIKYQKLKKQMKKEIELYGMSDQEPSPEQKMENQEKISKRRGITQSELKNQLAEFADKEDKESSVSELTDISSSLSEDETKDKTFNENLKVISKTRTASVVARDRFSILRAKELALVLAKQKRASELTNKVPADQAETSQKNLLNDSNSLNNGGLGDCDGAAKQGSIHTIKEDEDDSSESSSSNESNLLSAVSPAKSLMSQENSISGSPQTQNQAKVQRQSEQPRKLRPVSKGGFLRPPTNSIKSCDASSQGDISDGGIVNPISVAQKERRETPKRKFLLRDNYITGGSGDSNAGTEGKKTYQVHMNKGRSRTPNVTRTTTPVVTARNFRDAIKDTANLSSSLPPSKNTSPTQTITSGFLHFSSINRETMRKNLLENKRKMQESRHGKSVDEGRSHPNASIFASTYENSFMMKSHRPRTFQESLSSSIAEQSYDKLIQQLAAFKEQSKVGIDALNFEKWKADFRHKNQLDTMSILRDLSDTSGKILELMYLYCKSNKIHEVEEGKQLARDIKNHSIRIERLISTTHRKANIKDIRNARQQIAVMRAGVS